MEWHADGLSHRPALCLVPWRGGCVVAWWLDRLSPRNPTCHCTAPSQSSADNHRAIRVPRASVSSPEPMRYGGYMKAIQVQHPCRDDTKEHHCGVR
eukprot:scaffold19754_cov137-Isochrysis_galbana.AAC.9